MVDSKTPTLNDFICETIEVSRVEPGVVPRPLVLRIGRR